MGHIKEFHNEKLPSIRVDHHNNFEILENWQSQSYEDCGKAVFGIKQGVEHFNLYLFKNGVNFDNNVEVESDGLISGIYDWSEAVSIAYGWILQ